MTNLKKLHVVSHFRILLRNSLINELDDELEPKHILYASNEELIKMKDERK